MFFFLFDIEIIDVEGFLLVCYVDNRFCKIGGMELYLYNLNGSFGGIVGVRSRDGCVFIFMLYLERMIMVDVVSYMFLD